jgi:alpha-tubulin suppressor-like RCC1 family protein
MVLGLLLALPLAAPAAFAVPAQRQALDAPTVIQFSGGGGHSLALKSDGTVWTWGSNAYGQLGLGTVDQLPHPTPTQVPGLADVVAISNGSDYCAALKSDHTVWTWGRNNAGQLGLGTIDQQPHSTPAQVVDPSDPSGHLTGIVKLTGGHQHSLALKQGVGTAATLWAWGWNQYGQLGDGTVVTRGTPKKVSGPTGLTVDAILPLGSGFSDGGVVTSDGRLWLWGNNAYGEIGDGTTTVRKLPKRVTAISGVVRFGIGHEFVIAETSSGAVWSWGYNVEGNLGLGTADKVAHKTPKQITSLTGATRIRVGSRGSMALKSDGTVWAWGNNDSGRLGDGTTTNRFSPVQVINPSDPTGHLTGVADIAMATGHAFALTAGDNALWAWGFNLYRQLGTTSSDPTVPTPARVQGL